MYSLDHQVLRTDVAGMPLDWVSYRDAVRLYHLQQVEYTCGALLYRVRGGINARTRRQSIIDVNSIIATRGDSYASIKANRNYTPPLSNESLFARDGYLCLYCGGKVRIPGSVSRSRNPHESGWNGRLEKCSHGVQALQ